MILKTPLDTERESTIVVLWLFPLIPLLAFFALGLVYGYFLWMLLLGVAFWFTVWGYIYKSFRTEICFEDEKITLRLRKKTYLFSVTDIMHIEEYATLGNPFKTRTYKIYVQPNTDFPSAYFFVRNPKIQKNLKHLFPDVLIKKNIVL